MSKRKISPAKSEKIHSGIVKLSTPGKKLSKEHLAFNRLTKRIDLLQQKINSETEKMESLNTLYHEEIFVKVRELGNHKIKLSHLLHEKRHKIKLSKVQNQKLDSVIFDLLDDAFSVIEPDEATKELYSKYGDNDFDEELQEQEADMKSTLGQIFEQRFGFKLDPSLLEGDPDPQKIEAFLKQQIAEKEAKQKPVKKTKKQLEKEALEQQKEDLKKKSLRSVYLSLVKLLHPDTEQDENLRREKEEIMKKVTVAYDRKDMMELLKIEVQWVNKHIQNLENTDTDTIAIYVQLLKDQVQDLERELEMVYFNPRYTEVMDYKYENEAMAKYYLKQKAKDYISTNKDIASQIKSIEDTELPTTPIKQCIEYYYEEEDFSFGPMW